MCENVIIRHYNITNKEGLLTQNDELADDVLSMPDMGGMKEGRIFSTKIDKNYYCFIQKMPQREDKRVLIYDAIKDSIYMTTAGAVKENHKILGSLIVTIENVKQPDEA